MKLLPSLRQKKRYIVFEANTENSLSYDDLEAEIKRALASFLGQLGLSKASPSLIKEKWNPSKKRFILKVNHKYVDEIISALMLSTKIKNQEVVFKSIITSGTLKKASTFL